MFSMNKLLLFGTFIFSIVIYLSCTVSANPSWSIEGEYFEGCTCNPGCPCLFGNEPTHNNKCIITGGFHIKTGMYGQYKLDGQTVIGITDLTAGPDENWIVFYINKKGASGAHGNSIVRHFSESCLWFCKCSIR